MLALEPRILFDGAMALDIAQAAAAAPASPGGRWVDVGFDKAHVDRNLVTAAAWPVDGGYTAE